MKKNTLFFFWVVFSVALAAACSAPSNSSKPDVPVIAFLDAVEDETLAQARKGFYEALAAAGYSEAAGSVRFLYRNAQGDLPTMIQAIDYFVSQGATLIATCPTIATLTAVQRNKNIPVCSMVTGEPRLLNILDSEGNKPPKLFGAVDNLDYIGISVGFIKRLYPRATRLGVLFNEAEPQSVVVFKVLQEECKKHELALVALPANNSSETQLATEALIAKKIDAFFALPVNVVFASFEVIYKVCQNARVPIFTCEEGLVKRGAVFAYGADMYQWGWQSGELAVKYLKSRLLEMEFLTSHRKVYRSDIARQYGIKVDKSFTDVARKQAGEVARAGEEFQNFYLSAVLLGLALSAMALGIFISMRIFAIPDITTDGSYTLGGVMTAVVLLAGGHWLVAMLSGVLAGALAGISTGWIHTRLRVNALLAGILVMTALYSVNLSLLGKSNAPLVDTPNVFSATTWLHSLMLQQSLILLGTALGLWWAISYLLRTDFGLAMRATGNSETMIRANGVNTDSMKIVGLGIANALTAFSGALMIQYQGFADVNMGIGIVIVGLGSVMIGETLLQALGVQGIAYRIAGVILGAVIFRLLLALALSLGLNPNYLKLITSLLVLAVVALPALRGRREYLD